MLLTQQQQDILDGKEGDLRARMLRTLVTFGEAFEADSLVPVSSQYGHISLSAGIGILSPVYALLDRIERSAGTLSEQRFSANPLPYDKAVPTTPIQSLVFNTFIYNEQKHYAGLLTRLGLMSEEGFTCACYMDEVGNKPKPGDVLSWSGPSAVVYANSVLGARCNRNAPLLDLIGSVLGWVPRYGLLTDEGRRAGWIVKLKTSVLPDPQLLGSAIGRRVKGQIPYIYGLDAWLGGELNDAVCSYLKDLGAAAAAEGEVTLFHAEGVTPEAKELSDALIEDAASVYVIDDEELARVRMAYPTARKNTDVKPKLCFLGCPHLSMQQLKDWTVALEEGLLATGHRRVQVPTVMTAPLAVLRAFEKTGYAPRLRAMGVVTSHICPFLYLQNPLCARMSVISSSSKLCIHTGAAYHTDPEILEILTRGVDEE